MSGEAGMTIGELIPEIELAKALKISRASLGKLRSQGLPYLRIGGRVFYREADFMPVLLALCSRTSEDEKQGRVERKKQASK